MRRLGMSACNRERQRHNIRSHAMSFKRIAIPLMGLLSGLWRRNPRWRKRPGHLGVGLGVVWLSVRSAGAVILWSDPSTMLIFDNGAGRDILEGAVKRDDSANDTLYFKFHVDPQSDSTTEEYFAALELYEAGTERLGIGNALKAWAYSAFFDQNKPPESGPSPDYVDLRSSALDQSAAGTSPSY